MCLHHDGASGGKSTDGVAARNTKGEREVAGREYEHRSDRHQRPSDVGPRTHRPFRFSGVDAIVCKRAAVKTISEQPRLKRGSHQFAIETPVGEVSFLLRQWNKIGGRVLERTRERP
jgi:hypothetical protein